jgi:hypothetical protein
MYALPRERVCLPMIQETWLPSRCLAMGDGGYAMPLTIRYLESDVCLRSGFNCHYNNDNNNL